MTITTSPPTFQFKEKIDLTDKESQIFEVLLQVVGCFSLQTQIRVVGGWVRDKGLVGPQQPIRPLLAGNDRPENAERLVSIRIRVRRSSQLRLGVEGARGCSGSGWLGGRQPPRSPVAGTLLGQPCNDIDIALDNMLGT
ncbi:hypothetical protein LguiA_026008 [Lonicera macranthoides]